jgi:hypothetical protein
MWISSYWPPSREHHEFKWPTCQAICKSQVVREGGGNELHLVILGPGTDSPSWTCASGCNLGALLDILHLQGCLHGIWVIVQAFDPSEKHSLTTSTWLEPKIIHSPGVRSIIKVVIQDLKVRSGTHSTENVRCCNTIGQSKAHPLLGQPPNWASTVNEWP